MAASSKPPKVKHARYLMSLAETRAVRDRVSAEFLPLFDHLIHLADHSHRVGYPKRAGIELRQARKLADKYPRS